MAMSLHFNDLIPIAARLRQRLAISIDNSIAKYLLHNFVEMSTNDRLNALLTFIFGDRGLLVCPCPDTLSEY